MNEPSLPEESIFAQALEIESAAERAAYLDRACGENRQLRAEVEALLRADEKSGDLLDLPEKPAATVDEPPLTEGPGTRIGPYKLLQQIGEGGMGTVFMAEQSQPVQRKVALKLIKAGMDSRQVIARFEAERQALALMDHVNIARVLDAGATEAGRPYFVMELVHGVPITQYCDDSRLTPRERLELFVPVCQAIQHAHQKGIIHRDVKPSNVMITLYDGKPVPKVIDFGVAKATEQKLTERTLFTQYGTMIGTLEYMSPEQAEMSALGVDTRSDIYSLGVLLYELLTGSTPLSHKRVREAAYAEVLRMIKEEEPPRPSTRLSDSGAALVSISAQRHMEPAKLAQLMRGELDWIVMRALEKDRNRRYETASAFAADVQRYLNDEQVQACPPSARYRLRKFARRNKRALATGALLGVMLLVAVGAVAASALWAAVQAKTRLEVEVATKKELERNLYYMHIALADRERAVNNPGRAEELLDECPAPLRGWEWYYLKRQSYSPPIALSLKWRFRLGSGSDLAFSPDGRWLATLTEEKEIKVWDAATGQEVAALRGHKRGLLRLAFSPDGRRLASTSEDTKVKVWDTTTWREVLTFAKHTQSVHGVAFSPDSRLLASAGQDDKVYVWDAATGALLHNLPGKFINTRPVHVAFSPDGRFFASGSVDNSKPCVKVWDVRTGEEVHSLPGHTEAVYSVAFSPDGRLLASAGWDSKVKVWDVTTGREAFTVQAVFLGSPWRVEFSPDGRLLALADNGSGGVVKVYDATTGHPAFTLHAHSGRVASITFSPDGRRLASAGFDKTVKLWELATGQEVLTLRGHTDLVSHVLFDPSGRRLASASEDGTVKIWDATPLDENPDPGSRTLRGHTGVVYGVAFSPNGRFLASGSVDNTVKVWDAQTYQEIHTLRGHKEGVSSVAFSLDGRLATASADKTVKLWDAATGQEVRTFTQFRGGLRRMALSADGRRLATSDRFQMVQVWDTTTGSQLFPLRGHKGPVWGVTFSPDGKFLATAGVDETVKLWDAATGQEVLTFRGHTSRVHVVAFSPDGRLVASGGADQTVKVWERATGKELLGLPGHTDYIVGMAFSPDGRRLASAGWREVIVWDAGTGRPIKTLDGFPGTIWSVAFSPDGQCLAAAGGYKGKGEIKVWDKSLWDNRADEGR
jgi:WD40 repeat protein/serine/threonine protein kinase